MRKRILSIFLSVCLALSLLPTGALAEDSAGAGAKTTLDISKGSITIGADSVSGKDRDGNAVTTANSAGYIITGNCTESDECVTINGAPAGGITLQELIWKGANLQINADVTLDIAGTVTLSTASTAGVVFSVAAGKTLTLTGSGNLSAVSTTSHAALGAANNDGTYSAKLATRNYTGDLSFKGAVTVMNFSGVGLTTTGALTLDGNSSGMAVSGVGTLTLSGRTVTLADTISATGAVSVTAATGDITTHSPVYGESVSLTAEDGNISAESTKDKPAISTNGGATLNASKGSISVSSPSGTGGAIYVGTGTAELTAGTGIAVKAGACCAVSGKLTASTAAGDISLTSAGAADSNAVSKLATQLTATTGSITLTNSESGVTPGELLLDGTVLAQKGVFAAVGNPSVTYMLRTDLLTADANGRYQWSSDQKDYTRCGTDAGKGLDLSSTPTAATCYRAGDGYVRWEPTRSEAVVTGGTLVLHNATITNTNGDALFAPGVPVTVTLDAGTTNTLTGTSAGLRANNNLTIGGSGRLAAVGTDAGVRVSNSTLTVMDSADVTASGHSGISADNDITVSGTASVAASGSEFAIQSENGSVSITSTGAVSAPAVAAKGTFTKGASTVLTGGTLAETHNGKDTDTVRTVYGNYTLSQNMSVKDCSGEDGLTVPAGAKLTIPSGTTLTVEDDTNAAGVPQITNNGTLVNNGTIVLPKTFAADISAAVKALKLTGVGVVKADTGTMDQKFNQEIYDIYSNSGVKPTAVVQETVSLNNDGTQENYTYKKDDSTQAATLTLKDGTAVLGDIQLPEGVAVTIVPSGTVNIVGDLAAPTDNAHPGNLTIEKGTLNVGGGLNVPAGTNQVTVSDNAKVNFGGSVSISDGSAGKLDVKSGAALSANGAQNSSAIEVGTLEITGSGSSVTAHSDGTAAAVHTTKGSVSVINGANLTTGCKYGVLVEEGKFTVDQYSSFDADATEAAICVKNAAEDSLVLPTLDTTKYKIAKCNDGPDTYWSVVGINDTLQYTDGKLVNAVKELHLKAASSNGNNNSDRGGSGGSDGSGSASVSYTITAAAGEGGTITPNGKTTVKSGASQTCTIAPADGYTLLDVLVDGKSVGALTSYTFDKIAASHTITASFFKNYTDVQSSDWFKDAVDDMTRRGLMGGTGDGGFSPCAAMDRAMLVTVLYRMAGSPAAAAKAPFTDVVPGAYYADAVAWASANRLVNGFEDNSFRPTLPVTREQLAAILYRYAQFKGYDTTQSGMAIREFSDYASISAYALPAMQWAVSAGLLQGSDNALTPKASAQRCQVAAILSRFEQKIVK